MKKLIFPLFIFLSTGLSAQTKLGLKLAPVIVSNRVSNDAQTTGKNGSAVKLSVGLVVDKPLSDTYYFSTGLFYVPKRAFFTESTNSIEEEYKLQYLQVPLSLKLFTNEVAPNFKIFFQIGMAVEFKVFDEPGAPDFTLIEKFNFLDASVLLGAGVEYLAGINTTLFGGISYQRGLVNVVNTTLNNTAEDLAIRNTIVSFDLGVKF